MSLCLAVNQSNNQSVNHSTNQSVNQAINQSIYLLINQSINQSVGRPIDWSFNKKIHSWQNATMITYRFHKNPFHCLTIYNARENHSTGSQCIYVCLSVETNCRLNKFNVLLCEILLCIKYIYTDAKINSYTFNSCQNNFQVYASRQLYKKNTCINTNSQNAYKYAYTYNHTYG